MFSAESFCKFLRCVIFIHHDSSDFSIAKVHVKLEYWCRIVCDCSNCGWSLRSRFWFWSVLFRLGLFAMNLRFEGQFLLWSPVFNFLLSYLWRFLPLLLLLCPILIQNLVNILRNIFRKRLWLNLWFEATVFKLLTIFLSLHDLLTSFIQLPFLNQRVIDWRIIDCLIFEYFCNVFWLRIYLRLKSVDMVFWHCWHLFLS